MMEAGRAAGSHLLVHGLRAPSSHRLGRPTSALALILVLLTWGCGGESAPADTEPDTAVDTEVEVEPDGDTDVEVEPDGDPDTAEVGPDTSIDIEEEVSSTGFPAEGLLIRILEPGAHGVADATGPSVILGGVLFGNATAIVWQAGTQSGSAVPTHFWQAGPIALTPGDNRITVTATDGVSSVGDSVVVTYNPAFRFDGPLAVSPQTLWQGESTEVVFSIALTRTGQVDLERLELIEVNEAGDFIAVAGTLADDGSLDTSGDEIEQDGVFTRTQTVTCTGPRFYRARVPVTAGAGYDAISPLVRVDCLERLSRASCETKQVVLGAAASAIEGGASPEVVAGQLAQDPLIAEAGVGGEGERALWVVFEDGVLGAVLLPRPGMRGAVVPVDLVKTAAQATMAVTELPLLSKRAIVLSPSSGELSADESADLATRLRDMECPAFEVEAERALLGPEASLARLRSLSGFGIATLATHGAELFATMSPTRMRGYRFAHIGPQEVLWSGSPVSCELLAQAQLPCVVTPQTPDGGCVSGSRCLVTRGVASDSGSSGEGVCVDETQEDLRLGRVVMTNRGYAVTPSFFSAWRGRGYPASLIHLGACGSMKRGTLASAFYAAGARAVSGFSGPVSDEFARSVALDLIEARARPTVGDVIVSRVDPEHGGEWRVFGASNLSISGSEVLSGGFEQGLVGWRTSGDGRALARFGSAQPVSGKTMGLVSTGLGFSLASGELRQTFCVPEGASRLSFEWKFVSEEFKEWCGTPKFQDRFTATLIDEVGDQHTLLEVSVDDLCGYTDGTCAECLSPRPCDAVCEGASGCYSDNGQCAGDFNCQCGREFTGLTPSDIAFDQGGVYEVMWRRVERDIARFAGRGAVTLVFGVEDLGDSLFDTAILIDEVTAK